MGSLLLLLTAFAFIFFVARGCVATQESTEVRKYVTSADSLLSESANLGNEQLQGVLQNAGGDSSQLDAEALASAANRSENLYLQALTKEEVPPEFAEAHHYLISALGIRERATARLADATSGDDPTASDGESRGRACEIYALYESPKNTSWARGDSNPHGLSATRP